jgi:photosystem II stability/assembly factor-like uncharacterized protein
MTTGATTPARGWTLRTLRPDEELRAVFGMSRDDIWIGGAHGTLLHTQDGGKHFQQARLDGDEAIVSIWAAKPDDVWVLGEHRVHRVDGGTLATLSVPLDYGQMDYRVEGRISGGSTSDVWIATGGEELVHTRDGGTSWTRVDFNGLGNSSDVWARSIAEIWVNLMFCVQHSSDSGATWTLMGGCGEDHYHVRGAGVRDVWVFTLYGPDVSVDNGLTWQGPEWQVGSPDLWRDVSPTGDGAAWGATTTGLWWGSSTGKWRRVLANGDLRALWASGPHDVWAVGSRGTILHGG